MKSRAPNATYVYCVVNVGTVARPKRTRTVALPARGPAGLEGAGKPRLVDAGGGYHLVVASAPLSHYDAPVIDARLRDLDWVGGRAAEHEAVVEHAAALGTVVPMKLFTMFSTDERAREHVQKVRRSLDRVVHRIAGCEEWGLRILVDEAKVARAAAAARASVKVTSGKDFLLQKKALHDQRRSAGTLGREEVEGLYNRLAETSRRADRRPSPTRELAGRVLLDAVFLVPTPSAKKVKSIVAASAKKLALEGFEVRLTGPWPAYSFIGPSTSGREQGQARGEA
jgi:hypothetical protein